MTICNNKSCSLGECDQPETCAAYVPVITRADKIRAMSDEELANLLTWISNTGGWVSEMYREALRNKITEWLKQPVKEEQ